MVVWALVVVFIFILSYFVIPVFRNLEFFRFVSVFGIIFSLLGMALILLSVKERIDRSLKKFLALKRASAKGFFSISFYTNI